MILPVLSRVYGLTPDDVDGMEKGLLASYLDDLGQLAKEK